MKRSICVVALLAISVASAEGLQKNTEKYFYVYHDKGDRLNHYIPSGWMGDYGNLKLNDNYTLDKEDGRSAVEWTYDAKSDPKQGANWAGVFWQTPANNWGEKAGGYDLTGSKRLTFWAKADKPVKIATFKVGGITGEYGDSDAVELGPTDVGTTWKEYTIDLKAANLTRIIGAFCWSASRDDNPDGFKLLLDEIRFER